MGELINIGVVSPTALAADQRKGFSGDLGFDRVTAGTPAASPINHVGELR